MNSNSFFTKYSLSIFFFLRINQRLLAINDPSEDIVLMKAIQVATMIASASLILIPTEIQAKPRMHPNEQAYYYSIGNDRYFVINRSASIRKRGANMIGKPNKDWANLVYHIRDSRGYIWNTKLEEITKRDCKTVLFKKNCGPWYVVEYKVSYAPKYKSKWNQAEFSCAIPMRLPNGVISRDFCNAPLREESLYK